MTRYAVDKFLWQYARDADFRSAFEQDSDGTLVEMELDPREREVLMARNLRAIFKLGAHPFLLYSFAIATNGGWSFEMMEDYVRQLEGLKPGDIET